MKRRCPVADRRLDKPTRASAKSVRRKMVPERIRDEGSVSEVAIPMSTAK